MPKIGSNTFVKLLPFDLDGQPEEVAEDGGVPFLRIKGWASTEEVDRDGEVVEVGFLDGSIPQFMRNAQMFWNHDPKEPVGLWDVVTPVPGKGYWVEGRMFHLGAEEDTRRFNRVKIGLVKTLSIRFAAYQNAKCGANVNGTWHWQKDGELLEISLLPLPANRQALFTVVKGLGGAAGQTYEQWEQTLPQQAEEEAPAEETKAEGDWHIGDPHTLPAAEENADWGSYPDAAIIDAICQVVGEPDKEPNWDANKQAHIVWQEPGDTRDQYKLKVARRDPNENGGTLKLFWRMVASRMGILMGAREGINIPDAIRKPAYDELARCYAKWDKPVPEFKGDWPESYKDVTWHNDEPDLFEEDRAVEDLKRLTGALESVRNISRHWVKEGGAPSAVILDAAASPIAVCVDVLKEGRVLSKRNREAVEAALAALVELVKRDDESRVGRETKPEEEGEEQAEGEKSFDEVLGQLAAEVEAAAAVPAPKIVGHLSPEMAALLIG